MIVWSPEIYLLFHGPFNRLDLSRQRVNGILAHLASKREVFIVRQQWCHTILCQYFDIIRLHLATQAPADDVLQAHNERRPQLHQMAPLPQKIPYRTDPLSDKYTPQAIFPAGAFPQARMHHPHHRHTSTPCTSGSLMDWPNEPCTPPPSADLPPN